jgi:hypothetical protein
MSEWLEVRIEFSDITGYHFLTGAAFTRSEIAGKGPSLGDCITQGCAGSSGFQYELRTENIRRKEALRVTVAVWDEVQGGEVDDDLRLMLIQST